MAPGPNIGDLYATAAAAWPDVRLDLSSFRAHVERVIPQDAPAGTLAHLRCDDLFLAAACARGDAAALRAFEAGCLDPLEPVLRRMGLAASGTDEVKQQVRALLLVGSGEGPYILTYAGRGALRGWVRSIAVRTALRIRERDHRETPSDDDLIEGFAGDRTNPELAHLKRHYRAEFEAAFREGLAALEVRERNLLRQHFFDGLSIDALGALYRVNRATAARWLAKARAALFEATRQGLCKRLKVDGTELESVMRFARSQIDVSIRRYLDPPG